jgi:hypothetical protein
MMGRMIRDSSVQADMPIERFDHSPEGIDQAHSLFSVNWIPSLEQDLEWSAIHQLDPPH